MTPLRVGLAVANNRDSGGIYQYGRALEAALSGLKDQVEGVVVTNDREADDVARWTSLGLPTVRISKPTFRTGVRSVLAGSLGERAAVTVAAGVASAGRVRRRGLRVGGAARPGHNSRPQIREWLQAHGIDLMVYPATASLSFECGLPYVVAVHDLEHRKHPEFPEVSAGGELDHREHLFANAIRYADGILVDSEIGRREVLEYYGDLTSSDRIHVLPFVPPPYLRPPSAQTISGVIRSYGLQPRFLLLPAQFWPHKNHRRVVEAISLLRREGLEIPVVMTGSTTGAIRAETAASVRELVAHDGLSELVSILGYVDDASLAALYAGCAGVLLPTFFGPTNIPVVEAWAVGVPVITSAIPGIREQCGDAAVLVDPASVASIADGMRQIWTDDGLRRRLVAAGTRRNEAYSSVDFTQHVGEILHEVGARLHDHRLRGGGR